jgi:hypothetical protein
MGDPLSNINNNQSNTDSKLISGVDHSKTSSSIGKVSAGGGQSSQVLNSDQSNTAQQTSTINDSKACDKTVTNTAGP